MIADEFDMIMEIADSISVFAELEHRSQAFQRTAAEAIESSLKLVRFFRNQGIRSDVVHVVYEKRMAQIRAASTVAELNEISKPAKPHFTGNGFITGPYDVPEEEMIFWSLASLKAPLNHDAYERYMELFQQTFGFDIREGVPQTIRIQGVE